MDDDYKCDGDDDDCCDAGYSDYDGGVMMMITGKCGDIGSANVASVEQKHFETVRLCFHFFTKGDFTK